VRRSVNWSCELLPQRQVGTHLGGAQRLKRDEATWKVHPWLWCRRLLHGVSAPHIRHVCLFAKLEACRRKQVELGNTEWTWRSWK
jgi:hypothetical protein